MKKTIATLLCTLLYIGMLSTAFAQEQNALLLNATVIPRQELAIKAPASGELAPFSLREGDSIPQGEALFTVEAEAVYAEVSGIIADVYASPGDISAAAMDRYGCVIAIERENRYEMKCNVSTGHNKEENRNLYVGTPVYLRSSDRKTTADGVITSVEGRNFTVAVIGDALPFTKDVRVYRDNSYDTEVLLAKSTLSVVPPATAGAEGTLLSVQVKRGDTVRAGDLLFTYIPNILPPSRRLQADPTTVHAEQNIVITSLNVSQGANVQEGQVLCTAYTTGDYQLRCEVEEGDLSSFSPGDSIRVTFEDLGLAPIQATVASISAKGSEEDISHFSVYFDFEVPEGVHVGMHGMVAR